MHFNHNRPESNKGRARQTERKKQKGDDCTRMHNELCESALVQVEKTDLFTYIFLASYAMRYSRKPDEDISLRFEKKVL